MIVFDTSAAINFLRGGPQTKSIVGDAEESGDRIAVTTITLFELLSPILHRRLHREEKVVRAFVRQTSLLGLDFDAALEASRIMGTLLRIGRPVNTLDVLIGGIAVSNSAERIVTSDSDFEEIGNVADIQIQII